MPNTATANAAPRRLLKPRIDVRRHSCIKAVDQIALFRQLRTMFAAGTPIPEALQVAAVQTESRRLAVVMRNVSTRVYGGATISESFGAHPKVFRPEWVQITRAAEMSGWSVASGGGGRSSMGFDSNVVGAIVMSSLTSAVAMTGTAGRAMFCGGGGISISGGSSIAVSSSAANEKSSVVSSGQKAKALK